MIIYHHKAPFIAKQSTSIIAIYSFSIGNTTYENKSYDETLKLIKKYIFLLRSNLDSSIQLHNDLLAIRNDSNGLVAASDFFSGAIMPPLSIWDKLKIQVSTLKSLEQSAIVDIPILLTLLQEASRDYDSTYQKIATYMALNQKGYSNSIETLTYIKEGAELVIGAYNPYIGGVYTAGLKVITQATELQINEREEIDWKGIAIELIIDELFSLAANKISDIFIAKLKLKPVQLSLPFTLRDKVDNLLRMAPNEAKRRIVEAIVSKFSGTVSACVKKAIEKNRNSSGQSTWKVISTTAAEQFELKELSKNVIEQILSAVFEKYKS
jgi:hypothetical protein